MVITPRGGPRSSDMRAERNARLDTTKPNDPKLFPFLSAGTDFPMGLKVACVCVCQCV